jgi:hypothetical protein
MPEIVSAFDLSQDADMAKQYCKRREADMHKLMETISSWEVRRSGKVLRTVYQGHSILHELVPGALLGGGRPLWGELLTNGDSEESPIRFETFENFAAYLLARFW